MMDKAVCPGSYSLREATREELLEHMDFFYELALDTARSGYPTYTDGIKTRAEFEKAALRRDGRKTLLLLRDGAVEGLIQMSFQPESHYLQTDIVNIRRDIPAAMAELEAYLAAYFSGYDCYLGFPAENTEAIGYLARHGWTCSERSYNDVFHLDGYTPRTEDPGIVPVSRENYEAFARLHDQAVDDITYWNSQRMLEKLDEWSVWLYCRDGKASAAIYYTERENLAEVFGIDYEGGRYDREAQKALLHGTFARCREKGIPHVVFFEGEAGQNGALEAGVHCVGEYVLHTKRV